MKKLRLILIFIFFCQYALAEDDLSLRYVQKAPTSLVGDGRYIVKTTPERFLAVKGLELDGRLRFFRSNEEILPTSTLWNSTFFPGGVSYDIKVGKDSIHVMYGVLPQTGFTVNIVCPSRIKVALDLNDSASLYRTEENNQGMSFVSYTQLNAKMQVATQKEMQCLLQKPYTEQLVLQSPNKTLDKSIAFSQYLLDLGYNGEIMLCELFRWLDIWARDLGSGQLPGGLVSGRAPMARQSLDYDLRRYALMSPRDCKNSNDPSQGGTSSEIGWTARSSWNYYLHSGDLATLKQDAEIIRPWVAHWISRDYDDDGLIIDVTEFMDHMIMMLSTDGVTTLAANAMYASVLNYFSKIEDALGNKQEAKKLEKLYTRTVDAINTVYWNQEKEYFNNMTLWGWMCERSSQASQSMLLKIGATDDVRSKKTLDYLQKTNWCDYGSITITPRMNHVGLDNDQNVKVWPWWNLWEAEARFRCNDKEGGYKLLDLAASTIEDDKYPGLIEETLDTDGISTGGNVFITAAGNLLDVVVKDLMGVEAVTAGWGEIKVVPAVPAHWADYQCTIPTPNGHIVVKCKNHRLWVTINDPKIKTVHVSDPNAVEVAGASKKTYKPTVIPQRVYSPVVKPAVAQIKDGNTALFHDPEFHTTTPDFDNLIDRIDVESLGNLQVSTYNKIIIKGNKLPLFTKSGKSIKTALESYVTQGGTVIFYGATVNARSDEDGAGILGEQCGIVDWYQYLPVRDKQMLDSWSFAPNINNKSKEQTNGTYRTTVRLSPWSQGKDMYIELGPLVGLDSVFVNNIHVADFGDMEQFIKQEYPTKTNYPDSHRYKMLSRIYVLKSGTASYEALRMGEENVIEVRISQDEMNYGFPSSNRPNIGTLTQQTQWQATDDAIPNIGFNNPKRKGVNYWGSEQFFNSWSTKNGLFGFRINGSGIEFEDGTALEGLPAEESVPVATTYTDFALFKPWTFEVLAYTTTNTRLLYPATTERYPCIVRVVNTKSSGGYVLITPSVVGKEVGQNILRKLTVKL